jgi:peptide-methionine (S)-S-oxide reductase
MAGMSAAAVFNSGGIMENRAEATFAAGCFWCVEAVFERVPGVLTVDAGYAGGSVEHPTYEAVCTGETGHAEVVRVVYDQSTVRYEHLLEVFWAAHDPTTLNRQGADHGTQYRSVIFYHDEAQRIAAEKSRVEAQQGFADPIVTAIEPLRNFFKAEQYHQEYFRNNPSAPYCMFVIAPKLKKLQVK